MSRLGKAVSKAADNKEDETMNHRAYVRISGTIFGIVSILHLLRVVNGWPLELGPWSVPMWISWCGKVGPAILCVWAFRLTSRSRA